MADKKLMRAFAMACFCGWFFFMSVALWIPSLVIERSWGRTVEVGGERMGPGLLLEQLRRVVPEALARNLRVVIDQSVFQRQIVFW